MQLREHLGMLNLVGDLLTRSHGRGLAKFKLLDFKFQISNFTFASERQISGSDVAQNSNPRGWQRIQRIT